MKVVYQYTHVNVVVRVAFEIGLRVKSRLCGWVGEGNEMSSPGSRLDNLGKGASGAAVQNMNLALGLPEDTGL